ncbi:signal-regulatory protein beta-2-like [Chelmon rostratus]|uniref:signal-regulatory protein beta-2-like n=1 Tax=Chelmon rostratus TaxID=109905 RepID=UPI001BE9A660|nr:signal-regulatory protein beta-2-like [Chelmon rostratus]
MLLVFYSVLMLGVGRCTDDQMFETMTVDFGQNVTLTCDRQTSWTSTQLFWMRLISGNLPEFLGGTVTIDFNGVTTTGHITSKQGPGTFILHISQAKLSDTGVYFCVKVKQVDMTVLKGTFLRIKGPEPDTIAVVQVPPSDRVRPGDPVTLQCSVLSDSEKKTCPGGLGVYWFRAGSHESHPSVIYAPGNSGDECEESPEARSPHKCVYNFFKDDISSSDAGTYYCAVATCGQMLFGNGTKLDVEDSQDSGVLFLLYAALALSLTVIFFLIYTIKRKSCGCCNAAVVLETNAATSSGPQRSEQRDNDSLVYAAPTFTQKRAHKAERRIVKTTEQETVYSGVRNNHRFAN